MQVLKKIPLSAGLVQSIVVLFGNTMGTGLSALALILISRVLGPTKFGEFSVGFAIALILNRICDLGLSYTVQRYASASQDKNQINRIFSYTTAIKITAIIISSAIGLVLFSWLNTYLHFTQPLIILAAFGLSGCTLLYEHLQAILQSLHRFSQLVVMNFMQSSLKLLGAIILVAAGVKDTLAFFAFYIAIPIVPVLFFKSFLPTWAQLNFKQNFQAEKQLMKAMASHSAIAFMAAGIVENIDVLFVQRYLNTYETGLFGGASRIALLFSLMAYSLGNVLNPRVARYQSREHLSSYLKKASLLAVLSIIAGLVILPFSKYLLLLTVGAEYLPGVYILNYLLIASFLTIAVVPFMALFFSVDAPWYFSISGILQLILVVGGNVLFVPEYGLEAAALVRLVTRAVLLIFTIGTGIWIYRKQYAKT